MDGWGEGKSCSVRKVLNMELDGVSWKVVSESKENAELQ